MKKWAILLISAIFFMAGEVEGKTFEKACQRCEEEIDIEKELKRIINIDAIYVTLDECLDVALENNFGIRIDKKLFEVKEYSYKNSLAKFLPEIGLTGYTNLIRGQILIGGALLDDINEFAMIGGLYVSHDLTQGGKTIFNAKRDKYQKQSKRFDVQNTQEEVMMQVATYYYRLLGIKLGIEVYIKNYNERLAQLKLLENLNAAGLGTKFDVTRGENELAQAEQNLLKSVNQFRLNQAKLANAMGINVLSTLYPIENDVALYELIEEKETVENLYKCAIRLRRDVKALENEIKSDIFNRRATYSELIPKIDLRYNSTFQGTAKLGLGYNTQFIVNADIPFGKNVGVGTYTKLRQQEAEIKAKELTLEQKKRDIKNDILNSYINSKIAKERAEIGKKQIDYATESVRLAELRMNAGEGILIDVIQTQTQKTEARINYISMIIEYNINQVELLYNSGLISRANLLKKYSP